MILCRQRFASLELLRSQTHRAAQRPRPAAQHALAQPQRVSWRRGCRHRVGRWSPGTPGGLGMGKMQHENWLFHHEHGKFNYVELMNNQKKHSEHMGISPSKFFWSLEFRHLYNKVTGDGDRSRHGNFTSTGFCLKRFHQQIGDLTINWLVVWNIWIIFPYIGNHDPNWRTHIFQRGRSTTNQIFYMVILMWIYPSNKNGWYTVYSQPQWSGWMITTSLANVTVHDGC